MGMTTPIGLASGDGEALWYDSGLMTVKASTEQTAGGFFAFEMLTQKGKMTPLHSHPDEEEIFYILDGEILTHTAGAEETFGAGSFIVTPRGTPHAFAVLTPTVRFLCMVSPAGKGEQFFRATAEPAPRRELPPLSEPDVDAMMKAMHDTGMVLLGPPPFPHLLSSAGHSS
ncbi:MAG: hypothetical protein QOJ90_1739 [Actinomycetota bacterium]|jgi:quercetin dioxygenase-like cupin family protein|nr:hypothetical protein [Actinomycetota bacterium]MDQ1642388.1 hypothetical protein [Actinomycetota bacterium]